MRDGTARHEADGPDRRSFDAVARDALLRALRVIGISCCASVTGQQAVKHFFLTYNETCGNDFGLQVPARCTC